MTQIVDRSLHVEPLPDGRWSVGLEGEEPLSWHSTATEAESAARREGRAMGIDTILLRDRYRRVRTIRNRW